MEELFYANRQCLAHFQPRIRALVTTLNDEQLRAKPQPNEWSIIENVGHLIDTEQLLRTRMQLLCEADNPTIVPYDQDAAVVRNGYQQADVWALCRTLASERQTTLAFLQSLRPQHLQRRGWHGDYGLWTVGFIIAYLAKHDYLQYAEIGAVLQQYNGTR